jgi:hypothetical protein
MSTQGSTKIATRDAWVATARELVTAGSTAAEAAVWLFTASDGAVTFADALEHMKAADSPLDR